MFSAIEILDVAVRLEENGERLYRDAVGYVADQSLRDRLLWLADEEVHHRERFLEMKRSIKPGDEYSWAERMGAAILQETVQNRVFSLEDVDFAAIESEKRLIEAAVEFEQDGVIFYEILCSFITDPVTLAHMERIIREERNHVEFFTGLLRCCEAEG